MHLAHGYRQQAIVIFQAGVTLALGSIPLTIEPPAACECNIWLPPTVWSKNTGSGGSLPLIIMDDAIKYIVPPDRTHTRSTGQRDRTPDYQTLHRSPASTSTLWRK
jgi:hypothetical protein